MAADQVLKWFSRQIRKEDALSTGPPEAVICARACHEKCYDSATLRL
jgi:hypothetical protein